ncbi:phosphatase PAP2 family protein [Halorubellus litoreus]|uniref:Phosphatase PAP2 family protein n=1 Tax=Halorubellus litoreus TaxID=755308 RepID=A0ABD5VJQ4_9EURY
MTLLETLTSIGVVVLSLHCVGAVTIVGRHRLRAWRPRLRSNLERSWRIAVALVVVLALNKVVRDVGVELSWLIGAKITGTIYALEGGLVATIQSFATPPLTTYFGFMYVYGYTFLLTFPLLAYGLHRDWRQLRVLLVAYALNYAVGLVFYVAFVAYGPRNFMPEQVQSLLYVQWPDVQLVTSRVNRNTNVFPSLHASLSATVALVAYRFRESYPAWTPIATAFAASIALATMYLGIHWFTDVVVGIALAVASVAVGTRFVPLVDDASSVR